MFTDFGPDPGAILMLVLTLTLNTAGPQAQAKRGGWVRRAHPEPPNPTGRQTHWLFLLALATVSYGNLTPWKAGFSKEGTFGPGFGRILTGKASKSTLRPAFRPGRS